MGNKSIRIRDFSRIVFFTGAGLSASCGIPTYRGKGGIWKEYDYQQYACQAAFDRDPEGVWEFHNYRRGLVAACAPNRAHRHIASCQAQLPGVTIITQNIDGMHQRAGARDVIELHGSLWRSRCEHCDISVEDLAAPAVHTVCSHCPGQALRPDITWFGDALNEHVMQIAVDAIESCDLLISIGTSGTVYPAAQLPMYARQRGATLVEVNPEETAVSAIFDARLRCTADEAMDLLCDGLDGFRG